MRRRRSNRLGVSATPIPEPRKPWYKANPERLQWELGQFAEVGLPARHEIDKAGTLFVKTELPFEGEDVELFVEYPFDFPDVEPTVYGPPLLSRHQNRRQGNFCLLDLPAVAWWPSMSGAHLVDEDLRSLLRDFEAGVDAVARGEADMPEPLSQHIAADTSRPVLVLDPFWEMELGADGGQMMLAEKPLGGGHVLIEAEGLGAPSQNILDASAGKKPDRHKGRWAALDDGVIPPWPTPKELIDAVEKARPDVFDRLKKTLKQERKRREAEGWIGLTFPEEGPKRGHWRRGWVFLLVRMTRDGERTIKRTCRALAFTAAERTRRIPELTGLASARIAVFGAGSIGAPVALELAKAGVGELDVIDFDRYDVNNAVRHILEPRWAGSSKAIAVVIEAELMNPFIKIRNHDLNVGGRDSDVDRVAALVTAVDLAIDATGSQSAARILQRRCREAGKPLVLASLTAGSYGGEVAVFRSDGPCFSCFALGQADGGVPSPSEGPRTNITPIGCSTPAFSGAGFDATALAALAARTAVRATNLSEYPGLDYDYVVVNFRGPDPWRQGRLEVHPNCPLCSTAG